MNKAEIRRTAESAGSVSVMILSAFFAVCCLAIAVSAASAYTRTAENYSNTFSASAAVKYVTNKIRAAESIEIIDENTLLLSNSGYKTLIFSDSGEICERVFPEGADIVKGGGETVFRTDGLTMHPTENGLYITAENGGERFSAYCRTENGGGAYEG